MPEMVARRWAETWWDAAEGHRCAICTEASELVGPQGLERARAFALELLACCDPRSQARLTVDTLAAGTGADVFLLAPGDGEAWVVVASSRPGTHDDVLLASERWAELATFRREGVPVLPGTHEDPGRTGSSVLVLPLLKPSPLQEAPALLLDFRTRPPQESTALAVLLSHLLMHRLAAGSLAEPAALFKTRPSPSAAPAPPGLPAKVAELEAANRRLEELARLRTRFVSDAAHELKTPLAILRSYLEALGTDLIAGLDPQQREFLAAATQGARRLQRLVEELLDLAALESGNLALRLEPVDGPTALRAVFEELSPLAELEDVDVRLGPLQAVTTRADAARLAQVLRNLFDNALKYTPPGGQVRLACRRRGSTAVFEVADTGVGIPAEELPRIFDEFYRVRQAPASEGAGLGLAIVRRLVLAMGGRIDVVSRSGAGSTFSVELPVWTGEA